MTNYDANNPFAGGNPPQNNDGFGQNNNGYGQADQGYGQAGSAYGQGGHDNQGYGQPNQGYQAFPNAEHQNNIGMQQGGMQYPGVGSRFVAYFIDGVVSSIVTMLIFFLFFYSDFTDALAAGDQGATTKYTIIISLMTLVIWYAYRVPMEAKFGGSLGRMATGTKVVTTNGQPVDFATAAKRNAFVLLASVANIVPFIGSLLGLAVYIAVGVTIGQSPYKQSFTDKFANAIVVRK